MILASEILLPQNLTAVSVLGFGFLLGLRHSVEADHLAAVSTLVGERRSVFRASLVGGVWGVGHTISLSAVGAAVILLKLQISESWEKTLEFLVAAMLIALGASAIWKTARGAAEKVETEQSSLRRFGARSLVVGMIHGLAGSAALTLIVAASISPPLLALIFIVIFGVGSIGGMVLASFLFSLPLRFTAEKFAASNRAFRFGAGIFSFALGASILYELWLAL
jgi:branched-subunit amino acid transport protein